MGWRSFRCWVLTQPTKKPRRDHEGMSNNGLLGFEDDFFELGAFEVDMDEVGGLLG